MTQTSRTGTGRRSRWPWWLLGICALLAFAALITATTLLLERRREDQRYRAAIARLREAGLPTSRQEFLATLPPNPPDEQNLALPFIEAANAIDRESELWGAFDFLSDNPPIESYEPASQVSEEGLLAALQAQQSEPPQDPLAALDVEVSPEARAQIEALAALAARQVDPDRLGAGAQMGTDSAGAGREPGSS